MKRGSKRLKAKRVGRSALAKAYALEHKQCELCSTLEGEHWLSWRERDARPCIASECHHIWTPPRFDAWANFLHACGPSHQFVETFARFGRLVCCAVKIESGEFDRELIRVKWHRDPIDAIHSDVDGERMGVPFEVYDPLWVFVREHF